MRSRPPLTAFPVRRCATGSLSSAILAGLTWLTVSEFFHSKAHADALAVPDWAFVMYGNGQPPDLDLETDLVRKTTAGMVVQNAPTRETRAGRKAGRSEPQDMPAATAAAGPSISPDPGTARRAETLTLFYRALRLEREGNPTAALPVYLQVMSFSGLTPELYGRLVDVYTALDRLDDALALSEKFAAKFSSRPEPLLNLSTFLERHAAHAPDWNSRALQAAKLAVKKFPGSAEAVHRLVRLYLAAQDRAKAQGVVETALKSRSTDAGFWLSLSTAARNAFPLDDPETREKHFAIVSRPVEKALTLAKDTDGGVLAAAADFYARTGRADQALPLYERVAVIQPGNLMARRKLGQCLRMAGRNDEAVKQFESLVAIDSGDVVAHQALVSLYEASDPSKALRHRAEVLRLEGGDPDDYAAAADELLKANLPTDALTLLKRGIFYNPKAGQLLVLLARTQDARGEFTGALKSLEEAESIGTKNSSAKWLDTGFYLQWAETSRHAGKTSDAESRYRQAIEKATREKPELAAPAYHGLGRLWLSENRNLDAAGELLRTACALVPDQPLYLDSLGWFHLLKKDWSAALSSLKKAAELSRPHPSPELLERLAQAEKAAAAAGGGGKAKAEN